DYLDSMASKAWDDLVDILDQMKILTQADGQLLELYAVSYSQYRQALDNMNKTGKVLITKTAKCTQVRRNPFAVEFHKYRDALNKMLTELGLTPSARSRIHANVESSKGIVSRKRA